MNLKLPVLILNVVYLIGTIIWAIVDRTVESFVAVIGGCVLCATFFVANDNSFSITYRKRNKQIINNKNANINTQNNVGGDYYENH